MPLDVDRVAEALLEGTKALIAKSLAPVLDENAALRAANEALAARLAAVEARDVAGLLQPQIEAIARAVDALPAPPDVSGFVTAEAMEKRIAEIPEAPEPADLSGFATKAELAEVRSAIPEQKETVDLTPILAALATKDDLAEVRAAIPEPSDPVDLSGLATKADVAEVRAAIPEPKETVELAPILAALATKDDLAEVRAAIPEPKPTVDLAPVLAGLATKDELAEVRAAIPTLPEPADLSGFATKADVEAVRDAMPDLTPYARAEAVQEALKALPAPKDYDAPMAALTARLDALRMPDVIHGKDGAGIADVRMNADGELVVKLTNGETYTPGKVRGEDGFGFDDMAVEHDGERTIALVFSKGERVERREFKMPVVLDRGVWKEGKAYEHGDSVSWAGSTWIAQKDTGEKPGDGDGWRLSTKKGRDGKPGGTPAPRPETVKR